MRRLLAISLLLFVGMPFVSPLFAMQLVQLNLPKCCRRDGHHHCTLGQTSSDETSSGNSVRSRAEKCPYAPANFRVMHHQQFAVDARAAVFAQVISHPAVVPQTQALRRISQVRSRQKRGPPSNQLA